MLFIGMLWFQNCSTTKLCKIWKDFSDRFIIEVLLKDIASKGTINKIILSRKSTIANGNLSSVCVGQTIAIKYLPITD